MKNTSLLTLVFLLVLNTHAHANQFTQNIQVSCIIPTIIGVNFFPNNSEINLKEEKALGENFVMERIIRDNQSVQIKTIVLK